MVNPALERQTMYETQQFSKAKY